MKKYLKTSEYAKLMGIHYRTAARHFHSGLLKGYQDENTKTIYIENPNYVSSVNKQESNRAVLYARVSSTQNKKSLDGQ